MTHDELTESGMINENSDAILNQLDTISMEFVDNRLDDVDYVKSLIEGILLMNPEPVEIDRIEKSIGIKRTVAQRAAHILIEEYQKKGMMIHQVANGLKLVTNPEIAEHLEQFFQIERRRRVSRAALQTLSIIAYNQPITKAEIESFRGGINSVGVLQSLLDRDLIKIAGRKETPGNPYLYSVSDSFLDYFGLKNIDELKEKLPAVEEELAKEGGTAQLKLKDLGLKRSAEEITNNNDDLEMENISNDLFADSIRKNDEDMIPEPDTLINKDQKSDPTETESDAHD